MEDNKIKGLQLTSSLYTGLFDQFLYGLEIKIDGKRLRHIPFVMCVEMFHTHLGESMADQVSLEDLVRFENILDALYTCVPVYDEIKLIYKKHFKNDTKAYSLCDVCRNISYAP